LAVQKRKKERKIIEVFSNEGCNNMYLTKTAKLTLWICK